MNFVTWIRLSVSGSWTVQADRLVGHDGEAGRIFVHLEENSLFLNLNEINSFF